MSAPTFPKPDPALAFSAYKIYGKPGDPLRLPHEDWDGARRRVADDPKWAAWEQKTRAATDDWIDRRRDHAQWICGWFHDFVSPRDGSHLTFTPDEPGEWTLHSPSDPKVQLTPKLHAAWVYEFRSRHGQQILNAARLFRLTGEPKYAEWVMAQLDFYAENFDKWPDQFRGSGIWASRARVMHQPLDEAVMLINHINAARLVESEVAPARKAKWIEKLFHPQAELLDESFQSIHNIACWQRSAMAHVALYSSDDALWKRAIDGPFGVRNQLAQGVTSDYLWYEQSLGYNSYVVQALMPLFDFAARVGRLEELRHEAETLENLALAPLALRFPDGRLPTPADGVMGRVNLGLLADIAPLFPTLIGRGEATNRRDWETLLDPLPAIANPALPPVESRNLESSRMAILRGGDWQIYFHYGQLLQSHAQAEALNFEATFAGLDISHDPGTVGYGSPLHSGYYTRGLAHNVPLIGGEGQKGWNRGELLAFDAQNSRVEAAQPTYFNQTSARRALYIENNILTDEVWVEAPREEQIGLALHLEGELLKRDTMTPDADFAQNRPAAFNYWKAPRTEIFRDSVALEMQFGAQKMRVTFRCPGEFRLTHADAPGAPPRRHAAFYLETTTKSAHFVTTFEPLP